MTKIIENDKAKFFLKKVLTIIKGIWYYKKALEREEKKRKKRAQGP